MSAAQAATAMKQSTSTPAHTARVGNVEIAIWRNQGANGDFYTASAPALAECAREVSATIRELKA
jgi:hypothetical protein